MEYTESKSGDSCEVKMKGKFTFSDHEKFREIISIIKNGGVSGVSIDVSGIEFVDSAALGMLLIAREEAEKGGINLVLRNPNGQISKMFKVSKFDSLFNIEQ